MCMNYDELMKRVMKNVKRLYIEAQDCPTKELVDEKWTMAYTIVWFSARELLPSYNAFLARWYSTNYHQRFVELSASRE